MPCGKCGCDTTKKGKLMTAEFSQIPPRSKPEPIVVKNKMKPVKNPYILNTNPLLSTFRQKPVQTAPNRPILPKAEAFSTNYF